MLLPFHSRPLNRAGSKKEVLNQTGEPSEKPNRMDIFSLIGTFISILFQQLPQSVKLKLISFKKT